MLNSFHLINYHVLLLQRDDHFLLLHLDCLLTNLIYSYSSHLIGRLLIGISIDYHNKLLSFLRTDELMS